MSKLQYARIQQRTKFSKQSDLKLTQDSIIGVTISFLIIGLFLSTGWSLLNVNITKLSLVAIILAMIIRTLIHTGLFIMAHDAVHGSLCPISEKMNNMIGRVCFFLYAFFLYDFMKEKHFEHHQNPATKSDPDYYPHLQNNFFLWYGCFLLGYFQKAQMWVVCILMTVVFHGSRIFFDIPVSNLLLFWVIPNFLSSFQLFYFGIFLPHRKPRNGYDNIHRAKSFYLPPLLSFLACYHFSYHWEHHEYPYLPWFRLPEKISKSGSKNP